GGAGGRRGGGGGGGGALCVANSEEEKPATAAAVEVLRVAPAAEREDGLDALGLQSAGDEMPAGNRPWRRGRIVLRCCRHCRSSKAWRFGMTFPHRPLVPKLCLGTHGLEALLRVNDLRRDDNSSRHPGPTKRSFVAVRSQAELGND